jgi:hypothetical protein
MERRADAHDAELRDPPRNLRHVSIAPLTADARLLLRGPLYSVTHVEAILALRRLAPAPGRPTELAATVGLPPGPVGRRCLDDLVAGRLAEPLADTDAYRYAPATRALRSGVDALAAAYAADPSALVRLLHTQTLLRPAEPRRW